jgi:hypothetical protein
MGGWKVDLELLGVVLMGTACSLIHRTDHSYIECYRTVIYLSCNLIK